jgi:hypothetical protein
MANVFQQSLENTGKESSIGSDYPYYKYIKSPSEIGMSNEGTLDQIGKNISGLINYVDFLVSGKSTASTTGQPLGNKFFFKTGGKCTDTSTNKEVDRYVYINNVPMTNIPFISSAAGLNFTEFKGLIPGTISSLNAFDPSALMRSFLEGSKPDCQEITMETIDIYNNKSTESHFVTTVDINSMDPCAFLNKKNPITGAKCKETFSNIENQQNMDYHFKIPNDPIIQAYFASLGLFGIYIIYRLMIKNKLLPDL